MRLKEWIRRNRTSQYQVAIAFGVSQNAVSLYVIGRNIPRREIMRRIFDVTHGEVTPNDFYGLGHRPGVEHDGAAGEGFDRPGAAA